MTTAEMIIFVLSPPVTERFAAGEHGQQFGQRTFLRPPSRGEPRQPRQAGTPGQQGEQGQQGVSHPDPQGREQPGQKPQQSGHGQTE